jgi:hypothetical protein
MSSTSLFTMNLIFVICYNLEDHIENEQILLIVYSATNVISLRENSVDIIIHYYLTTK